MRYIFNFPTEEHWRSRSRPADVESGLVALRQTIAEHGVTSVAVPPLGCGNGGLDWSDVQPLIVQHLGDLPGVEVRLHAPDGAPPPGRTTN
ncbi:macro domain-containing protein [Actinokineospora sp. PR83]|uniref:macro domain-containing protein n=1 Tax=Actinokineospora sp. PR83 TaxID=2884908 RepID=UPI0035AB93E4